MLSGTISLAKSTILPALIFSRLFAQGYQVRRMNHLSGNSICEKILAALPYFIEWSMILKVDADSHKVPQKKNLYSAHQKRDYR